MPMSAPRVTTGDAFKRKPTAFKSAMLANGLNPVHRTRWVVPATHGQQGGKGVLIHPNEGNKQIFQAFSRLSSFTKRSSAGTNLRVSCSVVMISLAE